MSRDGCHPQSRIRDPEEASRDLTAEDKVTGLGEEF